MRADGREIYIAGGNECRDTIGFNNCSYTYHVLVDVYFKLIFSAWDMAYPLSTQWFILSGLTWRQIICSRVGE